MPLFKPEELEELRRADAEIDEEFHETMDEIQESRSRDLAAKIDRMDNHGKKIAAQKAAYYEANREKYNAYMREYMRTHKESAAGAQNLAAVQEKEPSLLYTKEYEKSR